MAEDDGDKAVWVEGVRLTPEQMRQRRGYYFKHLNLGSELARFALDAARDEDRQLGDLGDVDLPPSIHSVSAERRYVPKRRLGRGGQGTVYEVGVAGDQRFAGYAHPVKLAALKLFEYDESMAAERAAYALPSPGLVKVLDEGVVPVSGRFLPYLVMEKLAPLPCHRVKDARVDLATAVDLFVNLLELLHGLHFRPQAPLVLNDIKPANIMLRMPAEEGKVPLDDYLRRIASGGYEPVLVDMGCAMPRGELGARGGRPAVVFGTPIYWAPETCPTFDGGVPTAGVYSVKSDVYALTLSWYAMLTGDVPYASTGVLQLPGKECFLQLLELKAEHASPVDGALLAEALGEDRHDVEEVLALGLHPDPGSRPPPRALLQLCRKKFNVVETRVLDVDGYRFDHGQGLRLMQKRYPRIHPLYNAYTGRTSEDEAPPAPRAAAHGGSPSARLGKCATGRYGRPLSVLLREESAALADPTPQRRALAATRLGKAGADAVVPAAAALVAALADPESVDVRSAAARALAAVPAAQLLEPLLVGLGHPSPDVRAEVVRLLARLEAPPPRVVEALTHATTDPARRVRERAQKALGPPP